MSVLQQSLVVDIKHSKQRRTRKMVPIRVLENLNPETAEWWLKTSRFHGDAASAGQDNARSLLYCRCPDLGRLG